MDPPEPKPEPVATCGECGAERKVSELDEGDIVEHDNGAKTLPYHCPDCGHTLDERLVREPDFDYGGDEEEPEP